MKRLADPDVAASPLHPGQRAQGAKERPALEYGASDLHTKHGEIRIVTAHGTPWSHSARRSPAGKRVRCRVRAARTCGAVRPSGKGTSTTYRLDRSTSVSIADLPPFPMSRSPSQWPGIARSSTSLGRSLMRTISRIRPVPECSVRLWDRRCVRWVRRQARRVAVVPVARARSAAWRRLLVDAPSGLLQDLNLEHYQSVASTG